MLNDYFLNDMYWKEHINKELEENNWLDEYTGYFNTEANCLDLGCGIGQDSRTMLNYGSYVISCDISDIALEKVREFNPNALKMDMRQPFPFQNDSFDVVVAGLSIHYFSDMETKKIISEVKRVLKPGGVFIGSVNGIQGIEAIKDTAAMIENHFYLNKNKYVRLFDRADLERYLADFSELNIEERETIRYGHTKNFLVFVAKK